MKHAWPILSNTPSIIPQTLLWLGVLHLLSCKSLPKEEDVIRNLHRAEVLVEVAGNEYLIYLSKGNDQARVERTIVLIEQVKRMIAKAEVIYARDGRIDLGNARELLIELRNGYINVIRADDRLEENEKTERILRIQSVESILRMLLE